MGEELRTEVERLEMTLENSLDELDRAKSEAAELRGVARKLAEAIQTYVEEHGEMDCFECYERMYNALGVALERGLLEQPRNKPCSKCASRMQVSYGEPDNKEIVPPHWWCRHCGHEEDK